MPCALLSNLAVFCNDYGYLQVPFKFRGEAPRSHHANALCGL